MARSTGEREIIARIREKAANRPEGLLTGIGDDCAVFRTGTGLVNLVTTDTMVEGVHFDRAWHPAHALGRKAAAVNISDIAAMGGTPRYALLSLGLTADTPASWLSEFMAGFLAVLAECGVTLIGGDTVQTGHEIMLSVTILGEGMETRLLTRAGARVGDQVMVSGWLGEAAAGLAICRLARQEEARWQQLVKAHLTPVPQVGLGQALAESGLVHAMMDLSDGLATDLAHICAESKVGAVVTAEAVPLSPQLAAAASFCGHPALDWALSGGEDYQLLFTAAAEAVGALKGLAAAAGGIVQAVGRIVEGGGVFLEQGGELREISYAGYEHFK
ncbi:thiamine-phosphate kinase [Thiovibrio sp. JS02]